MIVLIDNEHEVGYQAPWGEKLMAARVRIKYRLEDMTDQPCLIVRYNRVTPAFLQQLGVKAIFISGNSANADQYDPAEQAGMVAALQTRAWPVFGFCGGMQLLAASYGAPLAPIGPLASNAPDPHPEFAPGHQKEIGYSPVQVIKSHPLLAGLGAAPIFRHAHSWEVKEVPPGFSLYASTAVTPIQLIIHDTLPLVGTQFHPEYWTDEYPAGQQLIENFCQWVGLTTTL